MKTNEPSRIFREVMEHARAQDFAGYCKFDGLNSPLVEGLCFRIPLLRMVATQAIARAPLNIRPILGVKGSRNPKGIALFAKAFLLSDTPEQAVELLDWLVQNDSSKNHHFSGASWGYNFPWQSRYMYAPRYFPNTCVTAFVGEALILGYTVLRNPKYLEYAKGAVDFMLNDLPRLYEDSEKLCIAYIPGKISERIININSMSAAFILKVYAETKEDRYRTAAKKMLNYVLSQIIDGEKWNYTDDPKNSYVDNYHTGGILDHLLESMEILEDWSYRPQLEKAAEYYAKNLFLPNGAPKNRDNQTYPFDIHGSAQGIITFSKLSRISNDHLAIATKIWNWTIQNLYDQKGQFYFQRTRFYTKKFSFARWCNAWMAYAYAEYRIANSKLTA